MFEIPHVIGQDTSRYLTLTGSSVNYDYYYCSISAWSQHTLASEAHAPTQIIDGVVFEAMACVEKATGVQ